MSQSGTDIASAFLRDSDPGRIAPPAARRSVRERATAIAGVTLFAGLSTRQLRRLAEAADQVMFEPGQRIVGEGELGEAMYVVLAGSAAVRRGRRIVGHVMPGEFFGELSAIDGGPRTATVAAETPLVVLRLFRRTLHDAIRHDPAIALRLLEGMSRRLRQMRTAPA
jgi:CRP-like cAMP-binding protein